MGGIVNHSQHQDMNDWMRGIERRMLTQERRSTRYEVQKTLGGGYSRYSLQVTNWNDAPTWQTGVYWCDFNSYNVPDNGQWIGQTLSASPVGAIQMVWSLTIPLTHYQRFAQFQANGTPIFYDWVLL